MSRTFNSLCILLLTGLMACATPNEPAPDQPATAPWFKESAAEAGVVFKHVRATTSHFYFPEIMSGGIGWLDYNNDGLMDLYVVQGGDLKEREGAPPTNKLYRNIDGKTFEDVTHSAGVGDIGYGMGLTAGDYDNDGDVDLYVTNVGSNVLYRNEGNGTFSDVSAQAGVNHDGWGSSTAFADFNGDGWLDLYVVNYIYWTPDREMECFSGGAGRDYCHPANYRARASDVLYKNNGDGTFEDVSQQSGIGQAAGNGLGVVPGHFNNDALLDFYIANDGDPNQLWLNNGDGTFTDKALITGVSVNRQGTAEAGMGVVAFDLENDGDTDLFLAHLRDESNTLYRNDGGLFQDITLTAGLSAPSLPYTSFGLSIADFNHDGHKDLYVVNGKVGKGDTAGSDPFVEPNQVFRGLGNGKFEEIAVADQDISTSRGLASADYDNDGDIDLAIINNHGTLSLLENIAPKSGSWIGFVMENDTGIGQTKIAVKTSTQTYYATFQTAGSYQSANDPRIHIGLPKDAKIQTVELIHPDGEVEVLKEVKSQTYNFLSE